MADMSQDNQLPSGCMNAGSPKADSFVPDATEEHVNGTQRERVTEGKACVFLPPGVFYNPVQQFNRDMTIAVVATYASLATKEALQKQQKKVEGSATMAETGSTVSGITVLEALAASGLRSVRFALEIPGLKRIVANDYDKSAVELMKLNIAENGVDNLVTTVCADASLLMHQHVRDGGYDVIDLDPYGSPTKFLDTAVQAVKDGGLLCVTCTDMAILCGNASEKCWASYGVMSLKTKACHEVALRIALRCIDSHASRHGKYIVPLLSMSADFYIRLFVRVFNGAAKAKESASKSSMVYQCTGCGSLAFQPLGRVMLRTATSGNGRSGPKFSFAAGPPVNEKCQHCGRGHHVGGPIYNGHIHDADFVRELLAHVESRRAQFGTSDRMVGLLSVVSEELPDVPLYYVEDALCAAVHCTQPSFVQLRSAILHAGYRVSMSHAAEKSIKTDAPPGVLWDIIRCWVKRHPVNAKRLMEDGVAKALLSKEPKLEACFEPHAGANPLSRQSGLLRFQTGMKEWGPKARAKRNPQNAAEDTESLRERSKRLQNKKRRTTSESEAFAKTFPCKRLKSTGSCDYGSSCKYSHELVDGVAAATASAEQEQTTTASDRCTESAAEGGPALVAADD